MSPFKFVKKTKLFERLLAVFPRFSTLKPVCDVEYRLLHFVATQIVQALRKQLTLSRKQRSSSTTPTR